MACGVALPITLQTQADRYALPYGQWKSAILCEIYEVVDHGVVHAAVAQQKEADKQILSNSIRHVNLLSSTL